MPYTIGKQGSRYCVYKADVDGDPTGRSLGCHDTRQEAGAQIGAIESSEKSLGRELTRKEIILWHSPTKIGDWKEVKDYAPGNT